MEEVWSVLWQNAQAYLLGPTFLYSPIYLVSAALIGMMVWRYRGSQSTLLGFLFPRQLYKHPSTRVDVKVSLLNLTVFASGVLPMLFFGPLVTYAVVTGLIDLTGTRLATSTTLATNLMAALILIATQDFCRFLNHFVHHKMPFLWPFHSVHHSAEVLTPITFYRGHPVYYAIQQVMMSVLLGCAQGLLLFALIGQIEIWVIYLGTLTFQIYIFLGGHLRHSHIRLSYGKFLEHVLISPAQHQIHHSSAPEHFDKNFGEIFAIWDWIFGTLYIPRGDEELIYGIGDADGNRQAQTHTSLWTAMIRPFQDCRDIVLNAASSRRSERSDRQDRQER